MSLLNRKHPSRFPSRQWGPSALPGAVRIQGMSGAGFGVGDAVATKELRLLPTTLFQCPSSE
jgi:hypothetical protein